MGKWMLVGTVVLAAGFLTQPAQAQEVITTAPKMVASTQTTSMQPRRGMLQRLRERRGMTVVSQRPMMMPAATATTPSTTVVQAQSSTPATMTTQTQVMETRSGLLARLRERRGR